MRNRRREVETTEDGRTSRKRGCGQEEEDAQTARLTDKHTVRGGRGKCYKKGIFTIKDDFGDDTVRKRGKRPSKTQRRGAGRGKRPFWTGPGLNKKSSITSE